MKINRRTLVKGIGSLPAILAAPSLVRAQDKPERITVTAFGGVYEKGMREVYAEDFTKKTGIKVDLALGAPFQWFSQIEASRAKPPYDVVLCGVNFLPDLAKKGLFEEVSNGNLTNLKDIPQQFIDMAGGVGVGLNYGCSGLTYNKNQISNPPKSYKEFIDRTIAGEWVASIPSINEPTCHSNLIYNLNDVLGGTIDDITPVIEAVKAMRKNLVFWTNMTDFLLHMKSGDADIGIYGDGRTWAEHAAGSTYLDFINPTEGGILAPAAVLKPKNSNPWGWQFIDVMLDPINQAQFAERLYYGMSNSKVVYPESVKSKITSWDKTRFPPVGEISARIPAWTERWNREIGA
jgi:putative spermidine/putrescine transport system substrate-binding protein